MTQREGDCHTDPDDQPRSWRSASPSADGSPLQVVEILEFNTETMAATAPTRHAPGCNGELSATMIKTPFTLAYKGPLPFPVDKRR